MKRFAMLLFVPVVALSITLAGCGKTEDKATGDGDPQQPADPAAGDPAKEAAKKPAEPSASETLRGTWKAKLDVDEEKLKQSMKASFEAEGKVVDPTVLDEEVRDEMKRIESTETTLVFRQDGTTTMTMIGTGPEPEVAEGTWEILLVNKNIVKLKLAGEGESPREVELAFSGVDRFTMSWPTTLPIKPLVFNRVP